MGRPSRPGALGLAIPRREDRTSSTERWPSLITRERGWQVLQEISLDVRVNQGSREKIRIKRRQRSTKVMRGGDNSHPYPSVQRSTYPNHASIWEKKYNEDDLPSSTHLAWEQTWAPLAAWELIAANSARAEARWRVKIDFSLKMVNQLDQKVLEMRLDPGLLATVMDRKTLPPIPPLCQGGKAGFGVAPW